MIYPMCYTFEFVNTYLGILNFVSPETVENQLQSLSFHMHHRWQHDYVINVGHWEGGFCQRRLKPLHTGIWDPGTT